MKRKTTALRCFCEERKTSENLSAIPPDPCENWLDLTHTVTCNDEGLLKACALRQEKPSFCHKNGAAPDAHIRHLRRLHCCTEKKIARPANLHALPHRYALIRTH